MRKLGWVAIAILVVLVASIGVYLLVSSPVPAGEESPALLQVMDPSSISPSTLTEGLTPEIIPPASAQPQSTTTETIIILHTNDFHGAIEPQVEGGEQVESGGLVNLVSLIDELRAENPNHTLLLDAGDTFQGTYASNSTQGEVIMAAMNAAGYDAWALGNHEFDWGQELLRARINQAAFPVLAANVLDASSGEVWEAVTPYTVVEVGGARVAILGLSYPDTPAINRAENVAGLDFRGAVETARRYLPELEAQAGLVVVLSHLGYDGDQALAAAVDGIDVIVGGHSHVFLEHPKEVNGTVIVQAGAKGQVLGRLELTVDLATGKIVDYTPRKVLLPVTNEVDEINQDVKALVDGALAQAAETMDQPIGETSRALEPQRAGEFALGNLVVDAMLAADLSDGGRPDIAMHNNGGIRAGLPKGPITYGQLYAVLPFDNQLMALDLSGEQVLRILEHSVAEQAGSMQVAGMTFRFDMSKPVGQRILEATAGGAPLDPARNYRVVTIDYLAGGGDGQETFLEGLNPTYGDAEVWAVAEYIRARSPIDPKVEGRITAR